MKRMSHGVMLMVAVFLLHVPLAFAQVDRATVAGVVKDSSGGVVPHSSSKLPVMFTRMSGTMSELTTCVALLIEVVSQVLGSSPEVETWQTLMSSPARISVMS